MNKDEIIKELDELDFSELESKLTAAKTKRLSNIRNEIQAVMCDVADSIYLYYDDFEQNIEVSIKYAKRPDGTAEELREWIEDKNKEAVALLNPIALKYNLVHTGINSDFRANSDATLFFGESTKVRTWLSTNPEDTPFVKPLLLQISKAEIDSCSDKIEELFPAGDDELPPYEEDLVATEDELPRPENDLLSIMNPIRTLIVCLTIFVFGATLGFLSGISGIAH